MTLPASALNQTSTTFGFPYLSVNVALQDSTGKPAQEEGSAWLTFFVVPNGFGESIPALYAADPASATGTLTVALLDALKTALENYDWAAGYPTQFTTAAGYTLPMSVSDFDVYLIGNPVVTDVTPAS